MPEPTDKKHESDKEIIWAQKLAEVDRIVDKLGKPVDGKIKEPITAFLVNGFVTNGSCEGHIAEVGEKKHGLPHPWVDVCAPEPEGWKEDEEKKKEWTLENLKQQKRMIDLLAQFYESRKTPFDARLSFSKVGRYGNFRVQSFGAETMQLLSPDEKIAKQELYRKEMDDFAQFLKEKFLSE